MARVYYDNVIADYVKLTFRCNCGNEIRTELIPVSSNIDIDKSINRFVYDTPITCKKCKRRHIITFNDYMTYSYCEIESIADDNSIFSLHEIPFEYAERCDCAVLDYIEEIEKVKKFTGIAYCCNSDPLFLNKMLLTYVISIMDTYLGNTFKHYVLNCEKYRRKYLDFRIGDRKTSVSYVLNRLKRQSFQNLDKVVIPYYKGTFGFEIPSNEVIQSSVHLRNTIIHSGSRESDGFENKVSKEYVEKLINEVETLIKFVNSEFVTHMYIIG